MSYKIVIDSCGELPEELKSDSRFEIVPLTLTIGSENILDDATFDQKSFLQKVKESPTGPKSACPSPERYMKAFETDVDHIYAVTLSAELSGSYNSARIGQNLAEEENDSKKIYVFNSKSASIGETLIALKIAECEEAGLSFEETIETVERYIESQHTYFILDNLETLRKNGRLTGVKALVATALKIKPIMGSTEEGTICQRGQARGMNRALLKMLEFIEEDTADISNRTLAISHCNCRERAEMLRDAIVTKLGPKKVIVLDTAGVSTMYANDGGIIVVA